MMIGTRAEGEVESRGEVESFGLGDPAETERTCNASRLTIPPPLTINFTNIDLSTTAYSPY